MNDKLSIRHSNPEYNSTLYVETAPRGIDKVIGKEAGKRFAYQDDVLTTFINHANKLRSSLNKLVVPCGGGKSSLQVALGVLDIVGSGFTRKQLFVMPQCHISEGFFKPRGEYSVLKIQGKCTR